VGEWALAPAAAAALLPFCGASAGRLSFALVSWRAAV